MSFNRILRHAGFTAALLLSSTLSSVQAADGYELIEPPQNTRDSSKVEVVEFFWLGCPHCYSAEPVIAAWSEQIPAHIDFRREAPPLNPSWETHSRAFYAAQLLGQEKAFVPAMFEQIHEQKKHMRKPQDIANLAGEYGMDKKEFLDTMNSFAVETRMRRAMQMARSAGITGVPAFTINGKYRTGASQAGSYQRVVKVIDERAEFEREAMGLDVMPAVETEAETVEAEATPAAAEAQ